MLLCRRFAPALRQRCLRQAAVLPVRQCPGIYGASMVKTGTPDRRYHSTPRPLAGGAVAKHGTGLETTILDDDQDRILKQEQVLLTRLHKFLVATDASQDELDILKDVMTQMEDLFMVCVVGEFNAGKSKFVNALLGDRYLKEGVTPTTASICFIKHDSRKAQRTKYADPQGKMIDEVEDLYLPVDLLNNLVIVDTPGTNAVIKRHAQLTHRIVPRADVVIFLTSVLRPFSDSERIFLEKIAQWHKKVVLVVNQIDLRSEAELAEVQSYVQTHAKTLLGVDIKVFPISAKLALEAKLAAKPNPPTLGQGAQQWEESRFGELQAFLDSILTNEEKVKAKLSNPIGVAEKLLETAAGTMERRRSLLASDLSTLSLIDLQLSEFMGDIQRDVKKEQLEIDKLLRDLVDRADDFLRNRATIWNVKELWDTGSLAKDFEKQVIGNLGSKVDEIVVDISEVVAHRARSMSRGVLDFLGKRPGLRHTDMVGTVTETRFEGIRQEVLGRLQADVQDVMKTYNQEKEFVYISENLRSSVMQVAAVQAVGAVSAGALIATHVLDVTGGLLTASGMAVAALVLLPYRRANQLAEFNKKVQGLRKTMDTALTARLDRELHKVQERIVDCIGPYRRFVKVEDESIKAYTREIEEIRSELSQLRREIA